MGLIALIYRPVSVHHVKGVIACDRDITEVCITSFDGAFSPYSECPGVIIVRGKKALSLIAVPTRLTYKAPVFGGAFIYSDDERFVQGCIDVIPSYTGGAIPLYDFVNGAKR